jgi:3-oxoacyl-[acyl-carrier protein] reductase
VDNTPNSAGENIMADAPSIDDLLSLEGESVLVTGASSNIGQAIAARLASAGASVLAHFNRNETAVQALLERIGGGQPLQADLADEQSVDAMLAAVQPTLLVHNAALQTVQSLATMDLADWRSMMTANLDSAFLLMQRLANRWTHDGHRGAIVNISSIEGLDPALGHAHYATSKAGLAMLTRAAAQEFGAAGIRVNSVSPGLITRDGLADEWPDGVNRWQTRAPLGRLGTPNDVADAVLFLVSPASRWISGANLVVDGGMSAQGKW